MMLMPCWYKTLWSGFQTKLPPLMMPKPTANPWEANYSSPKPCLKTTKSTSWWKPKEGLKTSTGLGSMIRNRKEREYLYTLVFTRQSASFGRLSARKKKLFKKIAKFFFRKIGIFFGLLHSPLNVDYAYKVSSTSAHSSPRNRYRTHGTHTPQSPLNVDYAYKVSPRSIHASPRNRDRTDTQIHKRSLLSGLN